MFVKGYVSYFNHLFDANFKHIGKNLNGCHWGLGVTDELFNTFVYTLKIQLQEVEGSNKQECINEIVDIFERLRSSVVQHNPI
jgi:hypothetical protein